MSADSKKNQRRSDREMAERVQRGLSLLYAAGANEASQYMARVGISSQIVERVVTARYVRGARTPIRVVIDRR
jgi:hypothetical protein